MEQTNLQVIKAGNKPETQIVALVDQRSNLKDIYQNYKEERISKLPLSMRKKREEINSRLNIKSIMGIRLTLDNISTSLNVGQDMLKTIGTQENLIEPLQMYKKLEKNFARDLRDVVEDLDNSVVRSVKFYNDENKETLDEYTQLLTKVTQTYDQIENEEKKIKKYIEIIKEASEEHLESATKIEAKIKRFFNELSDMAEQMEDVNSGLQTFQKNVDGQQSKMYDDFIQKSNAVESKKEKIEERKQIINKLEESIINYQQGLDALKVATQSDQKQISKNNSSIDKAAVQINLEETYIELANQRKQEIDSIKKDVQNNLIKIQAKKSEYDEKLLQKKEEKQKYNDLITQVQIQI